MRISLRHSIAAVDALLRLHNFCINTRVSNMTVADDPGVVAVIGADGLLRRGALGIPQTGDSRRHSVVTGVSVQRELLTTLLERNAIDRPEWNLQRNAGAAHVRARES